MQAAALREIIALGKGSQLGFKSSFNVEAIEALAAFASTHSDDLRPGVPCQESGRGG